MGKTLIQIKDTIKTIANNHRQINYFGDEQVWYAETSGTVNYPTFWAVYMETELRKGEKGYQFEFYALDLIRNDRSNIGDIYNDMDMVMTDVIASLEWGGDADIDLKVESFRYEKVDEPFNDDVVAGHKCRVVVWTDFNLNECIIPTIT